MLQRCQAAYETFVGLVEHEGIDAAGLPEPKPIGALLGSIRILMSDNAANERRREDYIEDMVGLGFYVVSPPLT